MKMRMHLAGVKGLIKCSETSGVGFLRAWARLFLLICLVLPLSTPARSAWKDDLEHAHKEALSLYEAGHYRSSLAIYKRLARIGDRYAMYRISFAYERGVGVNAADAATAWAWAKVASETKVKVLEANEQRLWGKLSDEQKQSAQMRHSELVREYSELAVAIRMKDMIDKRRREMTGSRIGTVSPFLRIVKHCSKTFMTGICEEYTGDEYYGELKEKAQELTALIGQHGAVEVREVQDESDETQAVPEQGQSQHETDLFRC